MPNATKWTPYEDVALCKAYSNISSDRAVGTDQSSKTFWSRIKKTFELIRAGGSGTSRATTALQNRWSSLINPDVRLFAGLLAVVSSVRRRGSERSECGVLRHHDDQLYTENETK